MALEAADAIENGAKAVLRSHDVEELIAARSELGELGRSQAC